MDIALALGGGGSRGGAHVGVLRRLEQKGFRIRAVSGTSAGGIIAAFYAAGFTPDEIEAFYANIDQSKLFARGFNEGPGLLGLAGAAKVFEEFLGERTFADARIPCALTAVDIKSANEIILNEGRLVDAVLATIAIPGVFPPKLIGNFRLVDGGVLDPVPVSVARTLAPRLPVVAVVLAPRTEPPGRFYVLPSSLKMPLPFVERLTRTRVAQAFGVFLESLDLGSRAIAELRLEAEKPAVILRPEVGGIGTLDKVDVHHVVRLGEEAVDAAAPELERMASWSSRLFRSVFPASGQPTHPFKVADVVNEE